METTLDAEAEVVLAERLTAGDPAAVAEFDRAYMHVVTHAVASMNLSAAHIEDIAQRVREKLLVDEGSGPKIASYAGRGRLGGLVRVMALRIAISDQRKDARAVPLGDELAQLPEAALSPELELIKAGGRAQFREAFGVAVKRLTPRDRNFLRLHYFGEMTIGDAAAVYGVHRATATRWMARIREQLFSDTAAELADRLGLTPDELKRWFALLQSQLNVSLQRVLATQRAESES